MAPRPTLILHMGTHKTGTTSQQHSLYRDRAALSAKGLLYLDPRPFLGGPKRGHHRVAHLLAEEGPPGEGLLGFRQALLEYAQDHDSVLVSAEAFCRHALGWRNRPRDLGDPAFSAARRAYLGKLADFFGDFEIEPLLYLREIEDYAHSHYKESVFVGGHRTRFADDLTLNAQRFAYDRQIDLIEEAFGRHLRLRLYDDAKRQGVYPSILAECGVTPPEGAPPVRTRISPPHAAALWATGPRLSTAAPHQLLRAFATSPEGQALFSAYPTTLWPDQATRRAFARRFVSARAPSTNADPHLEPAILPWGPKEQARAEASFVAWAARQAVTWAR